MGQPPTLESLKLAKPDCVLYAGESGTAHALADALADYRKDPGVHAEMTLILSDASVDVYKRQEVAPNTTADGRHQNRRVDIQLLTNMSAAPNAQTASTSSR